MRPSAGFFTRKNETGPADLSDEGVQKLSLRPRNRRGPGSPVPVLLRRLDRTEGCVFAVDADLHEGVHPVGAAGIAGGPRIDELDSTIALFYQRSLFD